MKVSTWISAVACTIVFTIILQGGNPPPAVRAVELEPKPVVPEVVHPSRLGPTPEQLRAFIQYELAQTPPTPAPPVVPPPPVEPLSIKISGPKHPTLGDRPVWFAEVRGDAGTPRWRISPPATGMVEKFGGQIIEWEPPFAGDFTIYVSVGGANKTAADDAITVTVHPIVQEQPPPQVVPQQPIEQPQQERMANIQRDKMFWNNRVADLVNGVASANKIAEARSIGGLVLNLVLRVERDNFGGLEYTDDLRRQAIALLGPQRAGPWDAFFAGLGRDLTLTDLRHIEHALAHVALAAKPGPSGGKITVAKET